MRRFHDDLTGLLSWCWFGGLSFPLNCQEEVIDDHVSHLVAVDY